MRYFDWNTDAEYVKEDGRKKRVAYIAQEPIMGGELFAHIYHTGVFTEEQCRYFFKQIVSGIGFMHRSGFSHRDLKPENIVLDHKFNCKVVDFGVAASLEGRDGEGFQRTFRGTLAYMAPEILNREPYQGDAVDLFALGCILFVMRSGAMPFDQKAQSNDEIYKFFKMNRVDKYWATHEQGKEPGYFSPEFKDLVSQMLHYTPSHRPMLADIIAHPWMQGPTATNAQIQQDFKNRQAIVDQRVQEEFLQEKQEKRTRRGAFAHDGKLYVYGELTANEQEMADKGMTVVRPVMGSYICTQPENNCVFSNVQPEQIFETLIAELKTQEISVNVREDKWKLSFKLAQKSNLDIPCDEFDLVILAEHGLDTGIDEKKYEEVVEEVTVGVEILKVENQKVSNSFCIKTTYEGSSKLFMDAVHMLESQINLVSTVPCPASY